MSKGSPKVVVRLKPWMHARVMEIIERNNLTLKGEPWTVTSWILDAVMAKIAHQDRARVQREKRRAGARNRRLVDLANGPA